MSKLSEGLKALINASHARPGYTKAPANIKAVILQFAQDARSKNVGIPAWVTISTAASITLNCPEAMTQIYKVTRELDPSRNHVDTAELIREVGLKCISFNGIPRSINCLGHFYNSLDDHVKSSLSQTPVREYTESNLGERLKAGRGLWRSIYADFETKLLRKLGRSHPDLPVHILTSHYANLLSDPLSETRSECRVGRVLTSLAAVTCLRAQTGVGPQVTSHIFGLRKAYERSDGVVQEEQNGEEKIEGGQWLATDEGNVWLLESIDRLVSAIAGQQGTTFAPGIRAKL